MTDKQGGGLATFQLDCAIRQHNYTKMHRRLVVSAIVRVQKIITLHIEPRNNLR